MADIIIHNTISDLYKALLLPIDQELDFTIHALHEIHPEVPFTSPVFRANYYSFVFVKDGSGTYTTDEQVFPTAPRTIYFTNPGHIKAFYLKELREAYIITLTEAFLKQYVHEHVFEEFPFLLAETVPPKTLSEEGFRLFEELYLQIGAEFERDSPYKYKIISNLFVVILLKIKEQFWADFDPLQEGDRDLQIVKQFKQELERHYRKLSAGEEDYQYQVQDYARQLSLHPNYLSTVIKAKTGKTVSGWITEKTLAEARSLLKNTSLTAKEVGYRLGFAEPTHFSNYFKKHQGQ